MEQLNLDIRSSVRLESMRGIAAMQVALYHCALVVEFSPVSSATVPLTKIIFNGQAAVILFFVLSGMVLGLSLQRYSGSFFRIYATFMARRIFRIYPVFVVVTLLIYFYYLLYHRTLPESPSSWANSWFPESADLETLARNLLLLNFSLNKVTWTLRMELIGSAVLPLFFFLFLTCRRMLYLLLILLILASFAFPRFSTLSLLIPFLLGMLLPHFGQSIRSNTGKMPEVFVLSTGVMVFLFSRHFNLAENFTILLESASATTILWYIAFGKFKGFSSWLDLPFLNFAGRVSYSYYLLHPPFLLCLTFLTLHPLQSIGMHPVIVMITLWVSSSIPAFILANLFHGYIEIPMIKFSKKLTSANAEVGGENRAGS
jgi:peptidoglycan/LPS O-acetylase OafA/YrhL